ncbi:MAG: alpha/beta fold hydrolase [Deltaproteobacteria bacterium]|nr:alpha/beta fold hydrolase [Deltaproteobacteria bacterium]
MGYTAHLATGKLIAFMQNFSKIRVRTHGRENIPQGSIIFVVNHFTRIETILLPYHIYTHTHVPVWSLADQSLFEGPLSSFLEKIGAISTKNPERDRLIVRTLITGEANWIIFPEGRMVKDKEAVSRPSFFGLHRDGHRTAHTGAATLALRTEFYRKRLNYMLSENPEEAKRLMDMFQIENMMPILTETTWIVPINLTYYPLRSRENVLSKLAHRFAGDISDRLREELLTEGTMFFEGVDIDIRFGQAIPVAESLKSSRIKRDMFSLRQINFDDQLPSLPVMRQEATTLMHRFMDDIYRMTTVNHDHLFASLFKALPFNRISEDDFRRRVFLLTNLVPDKTLVFCHQSLEIAQIALMTDDRYHKYGDFLKLAQQTGIARKENGILLRIAAHFSSTREFHRIRIDNPLGVAANEVKPLSALQLRVRLLAWLPEIIVRRRVADILLRQADKQFEADYSGFHREDDLKERAVGAPFLLKGTSRRLGIVLLHGFLATPREMLELATYLHGKGYWVYCVRLRGHGTASEDLATRSGIDWIESVDMGYAMMSAACTRVVVGGFSFGGGLALDCATRIKSFAGVFAVSPPFKLLHIASRFTSVVKTWNRFMDTVHLHDAAMEYVKHVPERPLINYDQIPVSALTEMEQFMKGVESRLTDITMPTLIVQAQNDPVVSSEETELMFNRIGSGQKTYLPFDSNRHGILAGENSENVHAEISSFIDKL